LRGEKAEKEEEVTKRSQDEKVIDRAKESLVIGVRRTIENA